MLNTKDDCHFSPRVALVSDDELIVDSFVGSPPSESKVGEDISPPPSPAPNISPWVFTPPNNSPIRYNNQEGASTPRQSEPY